MHPIDLPEILLSMAILFRYVMVGRELFAKRGNARKASGDINGACDDWRMFSMLSELSMTLMIQ